MFSAGRLLKVPGAQVGLTPEVGEAGRREHEEGGEGGREGKPAPQEGEGRGGALAMQQSAHVCHTACRRPSLTTSAAWPSCAESRMLLRRWRR